MGSKNLMGITGITHPIKILFVDDEKNVLRSLERLFLDEKYEILTATAGKEGLEILEQETGVQIVVSDYRMPEMNGVEFLREVYLRWPDTVRIVLSGYADTASIVSAINEGQIYKFIPKPWNDVELKVTIGNAIDLYYLHRKNEELLIQLQHTNEELSRINESLEARVVDRTAQMAFQNKVLKSAQNILDALPVAIVGIDSNEVIVYCNELAGKLIEGPSYDVLGSRWNDVLPGEIVTAIGPLTAAEEFSKHLTLGGRKLHIKGVFMRETGQEGVILVFDVDKEK